MKYINVFDGIKFLDEIYMQEGFLNKKIKIKYVTEVDKIIMLIDNEKKYYISPGMQNENYFEIIISNEILSKGSIFQFIFQNKNNRISSKTYCYSDIVFYN